MFVSIDWLCSSFFICVCCLVRMCASALWLKLVVSGLGLSEVIIGILWGLCIMYIVSRLRVSVLVRLNFELSSSIICSVMGFLFGCSGVGDICGD